MEDMLGKRSLVTQLKVKVDRSLTTMRKELGLGILHIACLAVDRYRFSESKL